MVGKSLFLPVSLSLLGTVYILKRPRKLAIRVFRRWFLTPEKKNDVGLIHEPEHLYFVASYIVKINENILKINSSPWLSALQQKSS